MAIENALLYERSDMRLREQTQRLEALVQSLHDGLILSDLTGTVIYANKRVGELAGLATKSLTGQHADQILARIIDNASEKPAIKIPVQKILNRDGESKVELTRRIDDQTFHLRLKVFKVNDEQGVAIGRGIFFHDITADRELDRMRSSLISTVSHELRTPLAAIKGYVSTMLAEDVEWDRASQREFLTVISDESDRLTNLVNNLLDLSRIEVGSLKLAREKCSVRSIIQSAAKEARLTPGNKFEIHIEPKLPGVYADPLRLESILRNLIENSIKYAGEAASIRVDVNRKDGEVVFRVSDDGPGIPQKDEERIFERFYRVDNSLTRLTSGAGLGLAICQGLVRAHGGRIWMEHLHAGTSVAFTIPVKARTPVKQRKSRIKQSL
jgi:PAS domain S-box-containing protein